jgi:hypothetical protein
MVNKRGEQGALSVVSQLTSLLLQQNNPINNPRTAFCRDFVQAMKVYCDGGVDLLVVGNLMKLLGRM